MASSRVFIQKRVMRRVPAAAMAEYLTCFDPAAGLSRLALRPTIAVLPFVCPRYADLSESNGETPQETQSDQLEPLALLVELLVGQILNVAGGRPQLVTTVGSSGMQRDRTGRPENCWTPAGFVRPGGVRESIWTVVCARSTSGTSRTAMGS